MAVLVLAEHTTTHLGGATAKAVFAAKQIGAPIHVLVAGSGCEGVASEASKLDGVSKVLVANAAHLENSLAEEVALLIAGLMEPYEALVVPATASGKNIAPRVAALLDVMQISDITKVLDSETFERPIYAGNALQTVKSSDRKKVLTVRTASFAAVGLSSTAPAPIERTTVPSPLGLSTFVGAELSKSTRPELTSARIVVSGGRGIGNSENFKKYIEPIADKLGAAMGASRAAVDSGFAPNDLQVGQTGKVVAPELYIAVGISGAIQHLAGMKDSKVIVAINKDGEAPIFQVADYGLVADLFQALPEFADELGKLKN